MTQELERASREFEQTYNEVLDRWAHIASQCGELWMSGVVVMATMACASFTAR